MRGGSCCEEKHRTGYAVMVKQLSCGLAHGVVCRQRKESCEEKRGTVWRKEMRWHVGVPTLPNIFHYDKGP
jgi:hypothetical protein